MGCFDVVFLVSERYFFLSSEMQMEKIEYLISREVEYAYTYLEFINNISFRYPIVLAACNSL